MKVKIFDGKIFMVVDLIKYAKAKQLEDYTIREIIDSIIKEANLNPNTCEITAVPMKGGAA